MTHQAIFAAGCFWGVEDAFLRLIGVTETEVGYTGGHTDHPTYRQVCTDTTGHAEAVRVAFDPTHISYDDLLRAFWQMHDPTTLNRQGPDVGSQYRSVIFTLDDDQRQAAETARLEAQKHFTCPIVTDIVPASTFWRAEDYHQKYHQKHGGGCAL
jgi:peptide-methionine (S)-S-oxide reductase